jgi:peptide/nickel transport system permease protein
MTLRRTALRRVSLLVPTLLGVATLTFALVAVLPGSPVDYVLGLADVSASTRAALRAQYHLDEPLWRRYLLWLADVARLDLGTSVVTDRPVAASLGARLPATLLLGGASVVVSVAVGVPLGVVAAARRGTVVDELARVASLLGVATPNFWLALVALLVFGVWFGVVPTLPPTGPLLAPATLWFLVVPTLVLGTAGAAVFARLTRASMLDHASAPWVRSARARGISARRVRRRHVLRHALAPVVTLVALHVAVVVDGAVVVEQVFSWPGVGRLFVRAVDARDLPVVQAVVLLLAGSVAVANLLADLAYAWLDPRVRFER